jgi:hypothetical protein
VRCWLKLEALGDMEVGPWAHCFIGFVTLTATLGLLCLSLYSINAKSMIVMYCDLNSEE